MDSIPSQTSHVSGPVAHWDRITQEGPFLFPKFDALSDSQDLTAHLGRSALQLDVVLSTEHTT